MSFDSLCFSLKQTVSVTVKASGNLCSCGCHLPHLFFTRVWINAFTLLIHKLVSYKNKPWCWGWSSALNTCPFPIFFFFRHHLRAEKKQWLNQFAINIHISWSKQIIQINFYSFIHLKQTINTEVKIC